MSERMRMIDVISFDKDAKEAAKTVIDRDFAQKSDDEKQELYKTLTVFTAMLYERPYIDHVPRSVWTPCAEGYPTPEQAVIDHEYQKFFVTLQNLDGKRFIERCAYRCERWWMFDYQCYVDETHAIALAWMPCPTEPYNPDRKEDAK